MRIGLVSPLYESVPPKLYGGTERIVAYLADALTDLGHQVTLFASGDSRSKAKIVATRQQAIRLDRALLKSDQAAHLILLDRVRELKDQFDILHFHTDLLHFPFFEDMADRTVTTLHGRLDFADLRAVYARWFSFQLISVSDSQRKPLMTANWAATIHHGVPHDLYRFTARPKDGYLAFLGRVSPEKGLDHAIDIARRSGMKLKIAAKIDPVDYAYFKQTIEPKLDDPLIDFIGEITEAEKSNFLGNASALLFPIQWPEPFGLVMIEAMACGTPVIAWNHGSVPEIVQHELTGFIVQSVDEAVQAIRNLSAINRRRIRYCFEQRFTATAMAKRYLKTYIHILRGARLGLPSTRSA